MEEVEVATTTGVVVATMVEEVEVGATLEVSVNHFYIFNILPSK